MTLYCYDLLDSVRGTPVEDRYARAKGTGRIIVSEQPEQLAELVPMWPVVELPDDTGRSTIPVEEWAVGLQWSPLVRRWVSKDPLTRFLQEQEAIG